jgi:hypothetical protein
MPQQDSLPQQTPSPLTAPRPRRGPRLPGFPWGVPDAWRRHGATVRWLAVAYLAVAAVGKLRYALPHLLWQLESWSGLDVGYRWQEVTAWFAGSPVYGVVGSAVYPPASHAILWPLVGWSSLETARLLWAVSILAAGAALALLLYRLAASAAARDRLLVGGLVLASYPFALSVMVGQLGVHVAAAVAGAAFLLFSTRPRWWIDAVVATLLAGSLVKPTLAVPLVVAVLIVGGRVRPAGLLVVAYAGLTLVAAAAQPFDLLTLFADWHERAGVRVPFRFGVINLHLLLWWAGLEPWMTPASLLALAAASVWIWRRRDASPWILLGVAAIVARFWAHSTPYDDAILLLPTLALFHLAFGPESRGRPLAGWLFAAAWATLLTPNWAFFQFPRSIVWGIHWGHAILWAAVLIFLVATVERTRGAAHAAG